VSTGVHTARKRPDLLERSLGFCAEVTEERGDVAVVVVSALRRNLELRPKRYQPLLRPVVQVTLDAPALADREGDDAGARLADLAQQLKQREAARLQRLAAAVLRDVYEGLCA
jgi:hypothetical protein